MFFFRTDDRYLYKNKNAPVRNIYVILFSEKMAWSIFIVKTPWRIISYIVTKETKMRNKMVSKMNKIIFLFISFTRHLWYIQYFYNYDSSTVKSYDHRKIWKSLNLLDLCWKSYYLIICQSRFLKLSCIYAQVIKN